MTRIPTPALLAVLALACNAGNKDSDDKDGGATDTDERTLSVSIEPRTPDVGEDLKCNAETNDDGLELSWELDGDDFDDADDEEVDGRYVDAYQEWTCKGTTASGLEDEDSVTVGEACNSFNSRGSAYLRTDDHDDLDLEDDNLTVEAWALLPSVRHEGGGPRGIASWALVSHSSAGDTSAPATDYRLEVSGIGVVRFVTGGTRCGGLESALYTFPDDDEWHHVAGTLSQSTGEKVIYVDGKQVMSCTQSQGRPETPVDGPLTVGAREGRGFGEAALLGNVDDVRISRTVRYTEDFTPSIYHYPDADTVALYHLNHTSERTLEDSDTDGDSDAPTVTETPDAGDDGHDLDLVRATELDETTSACDADLSPDDSDSDTDTDALYPTDTDYPYDSDL